VPHRVGACDQQLTKRTAIPRTAIPLSIIVLCINIASSQQSSHSAHPLCFLFPFAGSSSLTMTLGVTVAVQCLGQLRYKFVLKLKSASYKSKTGYYL
jgi:hypothetical protein